MFKFVIGLIKTAQKIIYSELVNMIMMNYNYCLNIIVYNQQWTKQIISNIISYGYFNNK